MYTKLAIPFFSLFLICGNFLSNAQSIYIGKEKSTSIIFYSDAPLEKIEGKNTSRV